jgi:hypothetical protein
VVGAQDEAQRLAATRIGEEMSEIRFMGAGYGGLVEFVNGIPQAK